MDAAECRQQAEDCRRLAQTMTVQQRDVLLDLARTWDLLAKDAEVHHRRDHHIQKHREVNATCPSCSRSVLLITEPDRSEGQHAFREHCGVVSFI
jgi:phage anti-repressor protein